MVFQNSPLKPSAEWLLKEYFDNLRTCASIATEIGVNPQTVKNWINSYGMTLRSQPMAAGQGVQKHYGIDEVPDKDTLYRLHYDDEMTCGEIARKYGIGTGTISRWFSMNDISVRPYEHQTGNNHFNSTGYGEILGSKFASFRNGASKRDIDFKVTIEEIWNLFLIQERRCALTGLTLRFKLGKRDPGKTTASLDRIDSDGIYEIENLQWVHVKINRMKSVFPQDEFIEFCRMVAEYNLGVDWYPDVGRN